jgi:hypothetical protein
VYAETDRFRAVIAKLERLADSVTVAIRSGAPIVKILPPQRNLRVIEASKGDARSGRVLVAGQISHSGVSQRKVKAQSSTFRLARRRGLRTRTRGARRSNELSSMFQV